MKKNFVIITGPHAVGKMTVGQELAKITNLRLFHNHMSIELSLKLFDFGTPEYRTLNETIRNTVFEQFATGDLPGLIFTYMMDFDDPREFSYLQGIMQRFADNGADCHVVELCADFDERIERNKSENRLAKRNPREISTGASARCATRRQRTGSIPARARSCPLRAISRSTIPILPPMRWRR